MDGQLKCTGKREFTKRGVRFAQIKLQRASGYAVRFIVPADQAAAVELGGYYKIAILADSAPEASEPPKLNPGDPVLHSWKWAGLKLWRPVVLGGFTPGGSAIVRDWRHGIKDQIVKASSLTPAADPFPAVDDFTAILPGDMVLWHGKHVGIDGLVASDQAVVHYAAHDAEKLPYEARKLVPLAELVPLGGMSNEVAAEPSTANTASAEPPKTPLLPPRRSVPEWRRHLCWNRDDLYEEVWSAPLLAVAKKYGMSDVGLGKVCRKLKIPLPGRGYWAKRAAGHVTDRTMLPVIEDAIWVLKPGMDEL